MAETVNFDLSEPRLQAVASPAPQNFDTIEPSRGLDSFYQTSELMTPDGYDVRNREQAAEWLNKKHLEAGVDFEVPTPKGAIDRLTGRHISYSWSRVQRDATHEDGTPQNNSEHSGVTAMLAIEVMGRLNYPRRLVGEVVMKAITHDRDEAPSLDIGIYDPRRPLKYLYVEASHTVLGAEDQDNPLMSALMRESRTHATEADLINDSLEKTEPALHALSTKCKTQRDRGDKYNIMARKHLEGAASHPIGFAVCKQVHKLIGHNWHKWNCIPFEGSPDEIVEQLADEVLASKGISAEELLEYHRVEENVKGVLAKYELEGSNPTPDQPSSAPLPEGIIDLATERAKRRKPRPEPPFRPVGSLALAG